MNTRPYYMAKKRATVVNLKLLPQLLCSLDCRRQEKFVKKQRAFAEELNQNSKYSNQKVKMCNSD